MGMYGAIRQIDCCCCRKFRYEILFPNVIASCSLRPRAIRGSSTLKVLDAGGIGEL